MDSNRDILGWFKTNHAFMLLTLSGYMLPLIMFFEIIISFSLIGQLRDHVALFSPGVVALIIATWFMMMWAVVVHTLILIGIIVAQKATVMMTPASLFLVVTWISSILFFSHVILHLR